jgi:peroxiredoxin
MEEPLALIFLLMFGYQSLIPLEISLFNQLIVLPINQPAVSPPPPMFVQPLVVGDTAKKFIITEIIDRSGSNLALILFFNPKGDEELYAYQLYYAEAFQTHYKNNGLVCIGVSNNDSLATIAFKEKYGITLTLINDPDFDLHRAYGIAAGYSGVFLEDSKKVILYSDTETYNTSKIRKLVEKNIGQELTKSNDDPFASGTKMPDIKILGVDGKLMTISDLYGSPLVITFLSPGILRCGSCPAARRLEALNGIVDSLEAKIIVIIDYPATLAELDHLRQKFNLKFPAFAGLNSSQITLDSIISPLTLVLDHKGKILQAMPHNEEGDDFLSALTNSLRRLR